MSPLEQPEAMHDAMHALGGMHRRKKTTMLEKTFEIGKSLSSRSESSPAGISAGAELNDNLHNESWRANRSQA